MDDLQDFGKRIGSRLAEASRQAHWTPEESDRYMSSVANRRERFERISSHLLEQIIKPRLEIFARYFPNAKLMQADPVGLFTCWLGYCERFPASTKLAFSVSHDVQLEYVAVGFDASMMPVFFKFNEHDKLTVPLDQVNDKSVGQWVERRIMEFLESYLRIDRGRDDFDTVTVVDPVCGMRISRSDANTAEYLGHPYYFCSTACESKFNSDPMAYVQVKTI